MRWLAVLLSALALLLAGSACGKYGKPIRSSSASEQVDDAPVDTRGSEADDRQERESQRP